MAARRATYEAKAADGRAMTLDELDRFVRLLVRDEPAALASRPKVRIAFGGAVKSIRVDVETPDTGDDDDGRPA